jgi:hypothetical protein
MLPPASPSLKLA